MNIGCFVLSWIGHTRKSISKPSRFIFSSQVRNRFLLAHHHQPTPKSENHFLLVVFRRTFTKGAQVTVAKRPLHTGQRTFAVIKLAAGTCREKNKSSSSVSMVVTQSRKTLLLFLFNNNQWIYIYIHVIYFLDYVHSHSSMTSISLFVCAPLVRHRGHYRWLPGEGCEPNPHVRYPHDK